MVCQAEELLNNAISGECLRSGTSASTGFVEEEFIRSDADQIEKPFRLHDLPFDFLRAAKIRRKAVRNGVELV